MDVLIVDDNKIARATLKQLASQVKDIALVGEAADALEAISLIKKTAPQLVLLDIEMPGMSGIDLVKALGNSKPLIIFSTSKKQYATDAFDLNVVDYLVKPVTPARFMQAISKALDLLASSGTTLNITREDFLFIRDSNIIRRITLDEISFAEAMGDYVKIYTGAKFFTVHSTLKALEERLDPEKFIRVHRSYIVAINKVDSVRDGSIIIKDKAIPVADAYRATFNKKLKVL